MEDPDLSLQREVEALAGNARNGQDSTSDNTTSPTRPDPISTTSTRWSTLFSISPDDAIDLILLRRNDLSRNRISAEHWDLLRTEKEAEGYDRQAYEQELNLQQRKAALPGLVPATQDPGTTYLVEVTGALDSAEKVQKAAGPEACAGDCLWRGYGGSKGCDVGLYRRCRKAEDLGMSEYHWNGL